MSKPAVSCIMPTANRREFVPKALECYLKQDYAARELIVLDNGFDPVNDICQKAAVFGMRYYRAPGGKTVGWYRNLAVDLANGPLIAHWDDDDWSAPGRLAAQVELLEREQAEIVGFGQMYFVDQANHGHPVWEYSAYENYACGTSLLYTKDLWRRRNFEAIDTGEDNHFIEGLTVPTMSAVAPLLLQVARIHNKKTARKIMAGPQWREVTGADAELARRLLDV